MKNFFPLLGPGLLTANSLVGALWTVHFGGSIGRISWDHACLVELVSFGWELSAELDPESRSSFTVLDVLSSSSESMISIGGEILRFVELPSCDGFVKKFDSLC
jgi:hypothetical protein